MYSLIELFDFYREYVTIRYTMLLAESHFVILRRRLL